MSRVGRQGKILDVYWTEDDGASPQEMTINVRHPNGTRTLVVVPVDRMSLTLPADTKKWKVKR